MTDKPDTLLINVHLHARRHHRAECRCEYCAMFGCDWDHGRPCLHCQADSRCTTTTNVTYSKEQLDADPELVERVRSVGQPDPLDDLRRLAELQNAKVEGELRYDDDAEEWYIRPPDYFEVVEVVVPDVSLYMAVRNTSLQPAIDLIERLRDDCSCYEAMKEGVGIRIADLEVENEELRSQVKALMDLLKS